MKQDHQFTLLHNCFAAITDLQHDTEQEQEREELSMKEDCLFTWTFIA